MPEQLDLTTTNSDLAVTLSRLEERLSRLTEDMHEMRESLRVHLEGNGSRPGFAERVITLESRTASVESRTTALEATERERRLPRGIWVPMVVSTAVSIGSLVVAVLALKHP